MTIRNTPSIARVDGGCVSVVRSSSELHRPVIALYAVDIVLQREVPRVEVAGSLPGRL